ncbi:hypothetical protein [Sphingorhabdus sp.]|uniref:hypothetical protein n=1 Tax=Sphingorhabdus sp. TaxID=1902408 RepID=UPI003BB13C06|nr:hypothetical protein [Sphingomonadales bacterium]
MTSPLIGSVVVPDATVLVWADAGAETVTAAEKANSMDAEMEKRIVTKLPFGSS